MWVEQIERGRLIIDRWDHIKMEVLGFNVGVLTMCGLGLCGGEM